MLWNIAFVRAASGGLGHFVHAGWASPLAEGGTPARSTHPGTLSALDAEKTGRMETELLARESRKLRSALDAASSEVEETRADAIRLQGERDDALCNADDLRSQILSAVAAARDDEAQVQSKLDEALRLLSDGRDQASDEQWRLIEELDALHEELATCRQELAEARQTGPRPGGG